MATDYGTQEKKKGNRRILTILVIVVLILAVVVALSFTGPSTPTFNPAQKAAYRALNYMIGYYSPEIGLLPSSSNSTTFYVYPDNYLASLSFSRFSPTNSTLVEVAEALNISAVSFQATIPSSYLESQYMTLNSTQGWFDCPQAYTMSWSASAPSTSPAGVSDGDTLSAVLNTGSTGCATSMGSAEVDFIQAVYYHKLGDTATAMGFYSAGARFFDGTGLADSSFTNSSSATYHEYQTDSLSMYIFSSVCLSQTTADANFQALGPALMKLQDNSTGGFYPAYGPGFSTSGTQPDTLATSLAALALEQLSAAPGTC